MRAALLHQTRRSALQHDALRDRHLAQGRKIGGVEQARIGVRQEPGFLEDEAAPSRRDRRGSSAWPRRMRSFARGAIAQLRLVAEREQRLLASGVAAGARDRQDLLARQKCRLARARRMREGAVMANVPAKFRQRNENLARIGDDRTMGAIAAATGGEQQRIELAQVDKRTGLLPRQVPVVGEIVQRRQIVRGRTSNADRCEIGVRARLRLERQEDVEIFRTVDVEAESAGRQDMKIHALRARRVAVLMEATPAETQRERARRTACQQIGAAIVGRCNDGERCWKRGSHHWLA